MAPVAWIQRNGGAVPVAIIEPIVKAEEWTRNQACVAMLCGILATAGTVTAFVFIFVSGGRFMEGYGPGVGVVTAHNQTTLPCLAVGQCTCQETTAPPCDDVLADGDPGECDAGPTCCESGFFGCTADVEHQQCKTVLQSCDAAIVDITLAPREWPAGDTEYQICVLQHECDGTGIHCEPCLHLISRVAQRRVVCQHHAAQEKCVQEFFKLYPVGRRLDAHYAVQNGHPDMRFKTPPGAHPWWVPIFLACLLFVAAVCFFNVADDTYKEIPKVQGYRVRNWERDHPGSMPVETRVSAV